MIKQEQEYSYYVTSLACAESTQGQIAQIIRGHWNAVENGSHYRRDVTLGGKASLISGRAGAHVMATLRTLVLGLFELQKHGGKTDGCVPGWQRKMSDSNALTLIKAKTEFRGKNGKSKIASPQPSRIHANQPKGWPLSCTRRAPPDGGWNRSYPAPRPPLRTRRTGLLERLIEKRRLPVP